MPDEKRTHNEPLTAEAAVKVRKIQLDLLTKIDEICRQNNIHYVLFAGTLLGAVRHKGFIPWDDDIDLAMPREHFERFIEICKNEAGEEFFLQTIETDPEYFNLFARLRKNRTFYIQKQYEHFRMHHGVFIDIFPLDTAATNKITGCVHRLLIRTARLIFRSLSFSSNRLYISTLPMGPKKLTLLTAHGLHIYHIKGLMKHLYQTSTQIIPKKQNEYLTHLTNDISKSRYLSYKIMREDLFKVIEIQFEGLSFPAPVKYHAWLSGIYGDYLTRPPRNQRKPHHNVIHVQIEPTSNNGERADETSKL